MARKFRIITSSFTPSLCFALCLTLVLSGITRWPMPARTQSQQQLTPGGLRTTGAPSQNLPDLDTVRGRKEQEVSKPEPIPATRCRHWDKKCKDLKEKKTSYLFTPDDEHSDRR